MVQIIPTARSPVTISINNAYPTHDNGIVDNDNDGVWDSYGKLFTFRAPMLQLGYIIFLSRKLQNRHSGVAVSHGHTYLFALRQSIL